MRGRYRYSQIQRQQHTVSEYQLQQPPLAFMPKSQFMSSPDVPFINSSTTNGSVDVNNSESLVDDADVAAGKTQPPNKNSQANFYMPRNGLQPSRHSSASLLSGANSTSGTHPSDLEFFEDMVSEPVLVLGVDISHLDRNSQFLVCAAGVFGFSLLYGYLQELISVRLCGRQLGLFLAMVQFTGYTILAFILRNFVYAKQQRHYGKKNSRPKKSYRSSPTNPLVVERGEANVSNATSSNVSVPIVLYLGLSILRAIDLGMTNLAMQYINYPAKTLMKSSRVVFTMLFGVAISRKSYVAADYGIVLAMVSGLVIFMHADANSSAVFDLLGVLMLTVSLLCDGAISNVSETIMSKYGVGQDEFIFRMYSIALVAITSAAAYKGDVTAGFAWLLQPGTYEELNKPIAERTWTVMGKVVVIVLFSSMGFFGSSCSAAITKNFGALTMSMTSTARKASTLFLSFFLFNNVCTWEHALGVVIFIAALTAKSLRRAASSPKPVGERKMPVRHIRRINSTHSNTDSSVSDVSDTELALVVNQPVDDSEPKLVQTSETCRIRPTPSSTSPRLSLTDHRSVVGVI